MVKITIIGSTRFGPYEILAMPEKLEGEDHDKNARIAFETKFKKAIEESDQVIVYCPDGIGKHTKIDADYAIQLGVPVSFVHGYRIPKGSDWKDNRSEETKNE